MSLGIGAFANLIAEDEEEIIYSYGGYNSNEQKYFNKDSICDGSIIIKKECLIEPEIHEKIKKSPSGRKIIRVKRIPREIKCEKLIKAGKIIIENCSNCWMRTESGLDVIAVDSVYSILRKYQESGEIPSSIDWHK